jgi:hypothetical protein
MIAGLAAADGAIFINWTSPRKTDAQLRMFSGFELCRGNVPQR